MGKNKPSEMDPKETDISELPDEEFKILILKKLSEVQENTNNQLKKIRNIMPLKWDYQ